MSIALLLDPDVRERLARRRERRLFAAGQAAGLLAKAAGDATPIYGLAGRLYLSKSGWLLLSVPNALGLGVMAALHEPGVELPPGPGDSGYNAHISVCDAEEVARIGGDRINERGKLFRYTLGPLMVVKPDGWDAMSRAYFIQVRSPELERFRRSYGLPPKLRGHEFHITVAVRRKHVLNNNSVSKAAGHTHTDPAGRTYDVDALIARLAGRPAESLPLAGMRVDRSSRTGFSKKRYAACDPGVPGIVDEAGGLVDGRHRAARLLDRGATHGAFRRASAADMLAALLASREDDRGDDD